jgi:hypothetical protein
MMTVVTIVVMLLMTGTLHVTVSYGLMSQPFDHQSMVSKHLINKAWYKDASQRLQ